MAYILFIIISVPIIFGTTGFLLQTLLTFGIGMLSLVIRGRVPGPLDYVVPLSWLLAAGYTYYWVITPDPWPFRWIL